MERSGIQECHGLVFPLFHCMHKRKRGMAGPYPFRDRTIGSGFHLSPSRIDREEVMETVDPLFYSDSTQVKMARMLSSVTWALGGMGICPQVPEPPALTFATSISSAAASPLYLAATSL